MSILVQRHEFLSLRELYNLMVCDTFSGECYKWRILMKLARILTTCLTGSFLSTTAFAAQNIQPFPLDRETMLVGYEGGSHITLDTSCLVSKNTADGVYSYSIKVNYESKNKMLLSWNYLDWILNQYPNAISAQVASAHIFPIKIGKGEYIFRFKTKEKPLWFEHTKIVLFPNLPAGAEERKNNVEMEKWSEVTVSSHDYVSASVGVGATSCLPESLLVFPQNLTSGF